MCKARLLHYFPLAPGTKQEGGITSSSWCGWHNDHGSLTGLTPAMYLDAEGREVTHPADSSGLYVYSRRGEMIKVNIPAGHLAFQIGETAQVHSGGVLQATPHAVMATRCVLHLAPPASPTCEHCG
jgi:isopenicillin N synthase-like dioxygenase